jgi:dihydroorotate dehydrogenase electron transfer subunit
LSRYFKAIIIHNVSLNSKTNLLTIRPSEQALNPEPGQFYMLEVSGSQDPLLKRPFSFFRNTSDGIQFLYEVRGRGTMMMKVFSAGDAINVLGPLGKGYPKPDSKSTPLVIAGGIGIASVFPLIETYANRAFVFYGARNSEGLVMSNELKELSDKLNISTDDGSTGRKGTVVDLLSDFLNSQFSILSSQLILYACGRKSMLEAVSRIALEKGLKGYVSAEEHMACGLGACLGCAIKVKSKEQRAKSREGKAKDSNSTLRSQPSALSYKMVCKDGPVFSLEEILW